MSLLIFFIIFALLIYFTMGSAQWSVLKCNLFVAFGWSEGVFVSVDGIVVYHKTQNYLPTFPKVASKYSSLHESSLTFEDALARLSTKDYDRLLIK